MDIRKAGLNDSLLLSTLCMDVQQLHAQQHPEYFISPQSPDFAISFFDKMIADDATYIFIAEENGDALGYTFCRLVERPENPFMFARRYLMVEQISVRPDAQRLGAGRALMQQVELTARELGAPEIHLGSWDFNANAHGFFERMGFEQRHHEFWKTVE